jgi:hypothetical protein
VPTLASILKGRGFETAAIVNAPVLRPEFGLHRGFDHYDVPPEGTERRAGETTEAALEWLDLRGDAPFFLFVHYFDVHLSYSPPAPYDTLFDPDYAGPIGSSFDLDFFSSQDISRMRNEISALSSADVDHIEALYDGEIAYTDAAVGRLLEGLEELGLEDNTLVVLLSDHGEEFLEHGGLDHGHSLFGELTRVPLIFRLPGLIPPMTRIARYARLLDVTPTILDLLCIECDCVFEGVSTGPLLLGEKKMQSTETRLLPAGVCYCEALRRSNTTKSVIVPPWKLIYDSETGERLLFNLAKDPVEQYDLSDQEPDHLLAAEGIVSRCLVGMSDTWYIRMVAGGKQHVFDATIGLANGDRRPSAIRVTQVVDNGGAHIGPGRRPEIDVEGPEVRINDLRVADEVILAFQTRGDLAPVIFDLNIDGVQAIDRTYIGRELSRPAGMPFSRSPMRKAVKSEEEPRQKPDRPYFLIWHTEAPYAGETTARPGEATKRELRALGYIQ